jgi:hypothetical protein
VKRVQGKKYTTITAIYADYRGEHRWHFVTECGLRVRAGKSLTKVWNKWRKEFADENGRMDVENTMWMKFVAVRRICSRGVDDMKCKLV